MEVTSYDELWRGRIFLSSLTEVLASLPWWDKLDKFWVCESRYLLPRESSGLRLHLKRNCLSQTGRWWEMCHVISSVLSHDPSIPGITFYVLNCQQNYCFSSFSSQTAVSLVVLWARRFTPPSFCISQTPLANPAAMSLALPKLMGTAFWFTSLAWANLSNAKRGHQSSPVLYVLSARRFVVFWKVAT